MNINPQAILFDLDGTLIDTAPDFVVTMNALLAEEERPPIEAERIRAIVSEGATALITMAFDLEADDPMTLTLRNRFLDLYYRNLSLASQLFPDLDKLLQALDEQNIPWGIVTNKPVHLSEALLTKLDLHQRCHTLICPEHVTEKKPSPESLFLACQEIQVDAEACIYIGDHERDIVAGNAAGMTTIAALYGYIPPTEEVTRWQATHQVSTSPELHTLILNTINPKV